MLMDKMVWQKAGNMIACDCNNFTGMVDSYLFTLCSRNIAMEKFYKTEVLM